MIIYTGGTVFDEDREEKAPEDESDGDLEAEGSLVDDFDIMSEPGNLIR